MFQLEDLLSQAEIYEHQPALIEPVLELPSGTEISAWIDHTLLKPEATAEQIGKLAHEALEYNFASVCINPVYVPLAYSILRGTPVKVCTVIGFPLGATSPTIKIIETLACLLAGASEVDMVIHVGGLKAGAYDRVYQDVLGVVEAAHPNQAIVKVILETSALTQQEKIIASLICKAAGADFIKTSTGFGSGGATTEDVNLMARISGVQMKVKASGGIRTYADAQNMIRAGAARLGTSSGVRIIIEALEALES